MREPIPPVFPSPAPFVPADVLIEVEGIKGGINNALLMKVRRLVEGFPERTLDVIREWMGEPRYH